MTAATRKTATQSNGGSDNGVTFTDALDVEIEALWKCVVTRLTSVGGTANAITASSDTAFVAAIASYAQPMAFWLIPTADNTGAVTINIDSIGVVNLTDNAGAAFQGGELASGTRYLIGYDGTGFRVDGVVAGSASSITNSPSYIAQDQKTNGTSGGTFTSGAWQTRTLNTEVRNVIAGASLSSSQITLPAGSYYAEWSAPAWQSGAHQSRLFNSTDSTVFADGTVENLDSAGASQSRSFGSAYFTLTSSKAIIIQHRCSTTQATSGFGHNGSFGEVELYSEIRIWKS